MQIFKLSQPIFSLSESFFLYVAGRGFVMIADMAVEDGVGANSNGSTPTKRFLQTLELGPPPPPQPLVPGKGHTRLRKRGWWVPIPTRGLYVVLYENMYFVMTDKRKRIALLRSRFDSLRALDPPLSYMEEDHWRGLCIHNYNVKKRKSIFLLYKKLLC